MLQQLGEPDAVLHVGLAAGDFLDVQGVDQQATHGLFEDIEDGLPVHAGALHGDLGHLMSFQPIAQGDQVGGGGPEGADVLSPFLARAWQADADGHGLAMDIQPGDALEELLHGLTPTAVSPGPAGADVQPNLLGVLTATMRGTDGAHVEFVADTRWSHSDDDAGRPRCALSVRPFSCCVGGLRP